MSRIAVAVARVIQALATGARRLGRRARTTRRSRIDAVHGPKALLQRGVPGAVTVLLRAAQDGGAPSRAYLLAAVAGPERRALRWALRDAGDRPLSAQRCRDAVAALKALS